ncbi:MAG: hypothetical protein JWN04_5935 [Myxococcaceae bacterium]|nr:hypothetical protein [Myxococcaceae bacterium]
MTLKISGSMRLKKTPAEWLHEGANRHMLRGRPAFLVPSGVGVTSGGLRSDGAAAVREPLQRFLEKRALRLADTPDHQTRAPV